MPVVEKNDVDISKLFEWSKESQIVGKSGKKVKIFMRLLGDADVNRARVMALRRSAELRKTLRDKNSDERLAYIPDMTDEPKESSIEGIIMFSMRDITQRAAREIRLPVPVDPPSDATTEELEEHQKEIDSYNERRQAKVKEFIEKGVADRRKELSLLDADKIRLLYENSVINEICEQELLKRFKELCVFFGTYSDKRFEKRLFKDFSDFDNLPSNIKNDLMDDYYLLEIESEELKK